jgi:cohesin domain-containing protein
LSGASRRLPPGSAVLFGLLALALAACGGGGGGGPTQPPPPPPPPPPGIVFTPQGAAGANSISLASGAGTTVNTLFLEVRATQVTDLYGVAFDLTYPSAQLQYVRATAGPLLPGGAVQAVPSVPGTLVVGGTHLGGVPGATGSGVVLTLELSAVAAGGGSFAFSRNSAIDSDGDAIAGVEWVAGSVQVNR